MTTALVALTILGNPVLNSHQNVAPELIGKFSWQGVKIPINGQGQDFAKAYDTVMTEFLQETGAPGGALTVFYQGKKIYSKGFGYASLVKRSPFTPKTPSRISSVSKALTLRAVEILVKSKALNLNGKAVDYLKKGGVVPMPPPGRKADPRINQITIKQLIDHRSGILPGLNIEACMSKRVSTAMKFKSPLAQNDILGYILGMPLQSSPGTKESYSNYGYGLLGKIVEIVSQKPYEIFVREKVLGVHVEAKKWFVTTSQRKDKRPDESEYFTTPDAPTWDAFRWDILAGAGGWVAPVESLAEFYCKEFTGPGWDYTLFGSYTGAVTVMKVHDNSLTYAASVNYRRGNGPNDNEILFNRLEATTANLTLP